MLTFKTISDLHQIPPTDPTRAVIQAILSDFPRDPDRDGYIVLIQPGDTVIDLPELKGTIADMQWEGVWSQKGYYHVAYC